MNKNIKKLAVMALAGLTLCGTASAAPRFGHHPPPPAPIHHHIPALVHHHAPVVVHHDGPSTLGAIAIGAVIGGIIGACN